MKSTKTLIRTRRYRGELVSGALEDPSIALLLETRDPEARAAVQSWAGAGMSGLDSDDASFYGHMHVGTGRLPRKHRPGETAVDYEKTTWRISRRGARKLRGLIRENIGDRDYYSTKKERGAARELLGILDRVK